MEHVGEVVLRFNDRRVLTGLLERAGAVELVDLPTNSGPAPK